MVFGRRFPRVGAQVGDQASEDLPPGRALSYQLIDAAINPAANGELGLELTFEVVWPNGCGTLLRDQTHATVDGDRIHVEMYGVQQGDICTLALKTERTTVHVDAPHRGTYEVEAFLNENDGREWLPGFALKSMVSVGQNASHHVTLNANETLRPLDFGNRPVREFHVADFNMDGHLDGLDIDLLAIAIRSRRDADQFDLTEDGHVDEQDYDLMVNEVVGTTYGDANFDGFFDSSDFVKVFKSGKYEDDVDDNASWAEGDWNGDGDFNSSDLIFVFQKGAYSERAPAVDAVFAE